MKPAHSTDTGHIADTAPGCNGEHPTIHSLECRTVSEILARVGDKWSVLVVMTLGNGPCRFNEIKRRIDGISQRMLTLTLRGLERDGLVTRTIYPTIPPRVDYDLTALGRSLREPVEGLALWALDNRPQIAEARSRFDGAETRAPVAGPFSATPR